MNTKYLKTKLALTVTCKCGSCVAATMIYGGIGIDAEFMTTVAEIANDEGKIEIVNTEKTKVSLSSCKCELEEDYSNILKELIINQDISHRVINILANYFGGVEILKQKTLQDLVDVYYNPLFTKMRGLGSKSFEEIKSILYKKNLLH